MLVKNTGGRLAIGDLVLERGTTEVDSAAFEKAAKTPLGAREVKRKRLVVLGAGQPEPTPEPETGDPADPAGDPPGDAPEGQPE